MAYERHTWTAPELITKEKLNNIEDGVEEALKAAGGIKDVQTDGISIVNSNQIANIPRANSTTFGVVKTGNSVGTGISTDGKVQIYCAPAATIKEGTNQYQPIVPYNMRHATFYGLAKAAGDDTQAASSNPVGTYTDEAKAAIKEMLGISETSGAVRDVQTNGTSVLSNGVANIPVANGSRFGVVKTGNSVGTTITPEGKVGVHAAYAAEIKDGTDMYRPIVPAYIRNAAFHGLAKAAGDETQAASSNLVGDYTQSAKTAINKMLGSQEKNEFNELLNPAVNMSEDATIATAGTAVKCMKGLYLKANKVYRFTFTTASGLANDGAITICKSDGTTITTATLAHGETVVGVDVNVASDVTDGFVTLTFGDAGAVIHCEYRAKEYDTIHDFVHKGVGLDLGRRFKFMYHFGVDTLGQNEIPPNSLMDIDVAHRLGFTAYRLMPHATATPGKYICLHGNDGKFGVEVVARDGTDISNVAISSVPYSTIASDYVYNTTNQLYRTPPTLLDDALMRLKRYNMLPVISFSDYDGVDYITNLIGDKYVLLVYSKWYLGGKSRFLGVHSLYQSLTDAEFREVVASQAKPFNIALTSADLQSLTDEQIKARIDFAHANNCTISSAAVYDTTAITQKLLDMGLDYTASGWEVEDFMDGNLASLHANGVFSEFTHEGTVSGGVLTLGNGKKIGTNITMTGTPTVAKGALRIRFVGTLNIKYRSDANTVSFTSDGTKEVVLTSAFLRAVPGFEATASGTVKVYDCCYDATVC